MKFKIRAWRVFDLSSFDSVLVEIRFGEGGDDSKNFVNELAQAYSLYADSNKIKFKILTHDFGHCSFEAKGRNAGLLFSGESGKHAVQRYPKNGKGRPHTSIVSVAVLPLSNKESASLPEKDIKIKTQGGSGPGGQHQNKTDSAVRATHIPTGIHVFINGRSQLENKRLAIQILSRRVESQQQKKDQALYNEKRKSQVAGGCRSGKVRTYNFIEHRVTDHNTGLKTGKIKNVMKGQFDLVKIKD